MKKFLLALFAVLLLLPFKSYADQNVTSWLTIGGDVQTRADYLQGSTPSFYSFGSVANFFDQYVAHNNYDPSLIGPATTGEDFRKNVLLTNRFGLNMQAKVLEGVTVKARLLMYKNWGNDDLSPEQASGTTSMAFLDRGGVFDGDLGHVPGSDFLNVDYAYATWFGIGGAPVWFSIGRRPSTGGVPGNIRRNAMAVGSAGVPNFLIDYAFDGGSIGWAPYIGPLPGAYVKLCFGKGFQNGFLNQNSLHDTTMVGINVVPYNTDQLEIQLQWDRAIDIFDVPPDYQINSSMTLQPTTNLGNIDQYGALAEGKIKNVNYFASGAVSVTHPNGNQAGAFAPFLEANGIPASDVAYFEPGLLNDSGHLNDSHTGWAVYLGARYDIDSTRTKLGAEFNHGSRNWMAFAPAGDDIWTSKLGTRGNVYEVYVIQELHAKPIDKVGLAFFRLGFQHYTFNNTGSNSWVGPSISMDDINTPAGAQLFTPIKNANDMYLTFNVDF